MSNIKNNNKLFEILVPCSFNGKPTRTKHHQEFDKYVHRLSGGLTIFRPAIGYWHNNEKVLIRERMIPVRVFCSQKSLNKILSFAIKHYNQDVIMAYEISNNVIMLEK